MESRSASAFMAFRDWVAVALAQRVRAEEVDRYGSHLVDNGKKKSLHRTSCGPQVRGVNETWVKCSARQPVQCDALLR